jgi:polysaccharide export outer membrane protein
MSEQSSVEVPVRTPAGLVPAKIDVQEIDAEFIIRLEESLAAEPSQPAAAQFQLPPAGDYRLGVGDVINIVVWGHPDLTIPTGEFRTAEESGTVVLEDGTIFFPYAGVVKVEGRTLPEIRTMLTRALSNYIEGVQLEVRMAAFRSKRVYVVGEVNKPGIYNITDIPMTMVEAVNLAGGFTGDADQSTVVLTRDGQTSTYNLLALYEDGDVSQNASLRHGDIVHVPDNQLNKVYMMGEIGRSAGGQGAGSLPIKKNRLTLAEALSDVGNINMATASPYHIFVVRGGPQPEIFHLSAKEPDALLLAERFPLKPRDIVYVDTADLVRWNKFISNLLPTRNFFNIDTSLQESTTGAL